MENPGIISYKEKTQNVLIDEQSLKNCTKEELIKLAKDLSIGSYGKESEQRRKILQMIADRLSERNGRPP